MLSFAGLVCPDPYLIVVFTLGCGFKTKQGTNKMSVTVPLLEFIDIFH